MRPFKLPHCVAITLLSIALPVCFGAVIEPQIITTTSTADPLARTTPTSVDQHYDAYQTQRNAMQALIDTGKHNAHAYDLSKSRCWLEVSFHEYTRNDRSAFAQDAYIEAQRITQYLAKTTVSPAPTAVNGSLGIVTENPATQTLLLDNGQRLRSDLWVLANDYKKLSGYGEGGIKACGEQQVACAEVQLSHAGHEMRDQGWRHARPYIQLAENELTAAKKIIDTCVPSVPVAIVPAPVVIPPTVLVSSPPVIEPPPVVIPPSPVVPIAVKYSAEVLFNFDKRDMPNVLDYTKQRLDTLIAQIKTGEYTITSIDLIGHADRSNHTGNKKYNIVLSEDRVKLIKNYMVSQGIDTNLIVSNYKGDSIQIKGCQEQFKKQADLEACLLPNRRVEVVVNAWK